MRFALFATAAGAITLVLALLTDLPEQLTAGFTATLASLFGLAAETTPEAAAVRFLDSGEVLAVSAASGGTWVILLLAAAVTATQASWRQRGTALALGIPFLVVANALVFVALGWLLGVAPRPALALTYFGRGAVDLLLVAAVWGAWTALRGRCAPDPDQPHLGRPVAFLALLGVLGVWVLLGALGGLRGYGQALFGVSNEVVAAATSTTRAFTDIPPQSYSAQFGYQYLYLGALLALFASTRHVATYRMVKGALLICLPVVSALHVADLGFGLAYDAMIAKNEIPADSRAVNAGFSAATAVLRAAGAALPLMAWFVWRHREQHVVIRRAAKRERTSRALVGLLAVLLVASGCGSRIPESHWAQETDHQAPVAAAPVPEAPQHTEEPATAEEPAPPPAARGQEPQPPLDELAPAAPSPDPAPEPDEPDEEELGPVPLELAAEPDCVGNGDEMQVTAVTEPAMVVGMVVSYSDHRDHGDMGRFVADDDGVVVWRFTPGDSVPPGQATVVAVASTPNGGRGQPGETTFEVGGPLGCL